jgi:hypothetical protein
MKSPSKFENWAKSDTFSHYKKNWDIKKKVYWFSGGKQWQTTPKNLPRMQRTRAVPVAWLSSGLCPDRPKGWIPIMITMIGFHVKYRLLLPDLNETWISGPPPPQNTRISKFTQIRPLGTELFHERTHDGANSRFRNFVNAPKRQIKAKYQP